MMDRYQSSANVEGSADTYMDVPQTMAETDCRVVARMPDLRRLTANLQNSAEPVESAARRQWDQPRSASSWKRLCAIGGIMAVLAVIVFAANYLNNRPKDGVLDGGSGDSVADDDMPPLWPEDSLATLPSDVSDVTEWTPNSSFPAETVTDPGANTNEIIGYTDSNVDPSQGFEAPEIGNSYLTQGDMEGVQSQTQPYPYQYEASPAEPYANEGYDDRAYQQEYTGPVAMNPDDPIYQNFDNQSFDTQVYPAEASPPAGSQFGSFRPMTNAPEYTTGYQPAQPHPAYLQPQTNQGEILYNSGSNEYDLPANYDGNNTGYNSASPEMGPPASGGYLLGSGEGYPATNSDPQRFDANQIENLPPAGRGGAMPEYGSYPGGDVNFPASQVETYDQYSYPTESGMNGPVGEMYPSTDSPNFERAAFLDRIERPGSTVQR